MAIKRIHIVLPRGRRSVHHISILYITLNTVNTLSNTAFLNTCLCSFLRCSFRLARLLRFAGDKSAHGINWESCRLCNDWCTNTPLHSAAGNPHDTSLFSLFGSPSQKPAEPCLENEGSRRLHLGSPSSTPCTSAMAN